MKKLEKAAIFIDGSNLFATVKALEFDLDYNKLLNVFTEVCEVDLLRAYYFTALRDEDTFSSIRPLVDYLAYNGYSVVTKPTKEYGDKIKGNMDMDLAICAMELCKHIEHMILFSGDGDFKPLVEAVQRQGVRVTVVSSLLKTMTSATGHRLPSMIADELRRQADSFIDISDIQRRITRGVNAEAASVHQRGRSIPGREETTAERVHIARRLVVTRNTG